MTGAKSNIIAAAGIGVIVAFIALAPIFVETFGLLQMTGFACLAILALSLGFIWGFGGILSFGQAAFFGLGGYTYSLTVINLGDSTLPVLLAIAVPALFAAVLGYFMFYGRISDVYVGVITLTVSLILYNLFNSTAGDQYRLGKAALGGFNGIPAVPGLNLPFQPDQFLSPEANWHVSAGSLLAVYLVLRVLLRSHFGRVIVAVKENEMRASLIGYDPRFIKLLTFIIGGAIAGLGGCLFTNWGAFVSPTIFGLAISAQTIIWVTVGGLGTLVGPILGCIALQYLTVNIASQQLLSSDLLLGMLLLLFVLFVPNGVLPALLSRLEKIRSVLNRRSSVTISRSLAE